MISPIIKRNGASYGVVTGIILSLITATIYSIDVKLFLSFWTTLLSLTGFIIITAILLMQTKKQLSNQLSFKEAFTTYFICSLVGIVIFAGFKVLLYNVIDPSIKDTLLELTIKYLKDTSNNYGVSASTLNEMITNLRKNDPFSITEQLKGGFTNLFFACIFGLIMALIFKSKNTLQDN
ncbi:hypothetical protein HNP99_001659 [Flavobacterium sp. 28A]|uniref:DUF4199 domain-containing protein n=1 Tax=Flavobacterium sp. 28A TaxID=2735895 RepID=UPI00156F0DE0|nr:DUF4199 domain-containing protein [Flavobacterium sp. 28A]NRT15312.1 hypothetical protein [Flavobacterium sp. 28A]